MRQIPFKVASSSSQQSKSFAALVMRRAKQFVVSLTLVVSLVLGLNPIGAYASTEDTNDPREVTLPVCVDNCEVEEQVSNIALLNETSDNSTYRGSELSLLSDILISGDYEYTVNSGLATITKYNGSGGDVTIPNTVNGYMVTSLGAGAFRGCISLRSITFNSALQVISHDVFNGCIGLTSLTLPEGLQSIGERAFENCLSINSITIDCKKLSLVQDGFAWLEGAFANAGTATDGITVRFSDSCKYVPDRLFISNDEGQSPNIKTVYIASNVVEIGIEAFQDCGDLSAVNIEGSNLRTINDSAFEGCASLASFSFPNSVETIGHMAFCGCTSLRNITLPEGLQTLGERAFENCLQLTSIVINCNDFSVASDGYTWVYGPFLNAGSSVNGISVEFGNNCKTIPSRLFACSTATDAPNVVTITIPPSVVIIAEDALADLDGYTIYGYGGTVAWEYAQEHGIPFVSLGETYSFSDVNGDAWYYDAVMFSANMGLITGYEGANRFGPNDVLTRAQAAVILWRYFEPDQANSYSSSSTRNRTGLTDVTSYEWYTGAANWAVTEGIITGVSGKFFAPNDTITREQLCTIIGRAALRYCGATVSAASTARLDAMPDFWAVSDWARQSVAWSLHVGVISGIDENGVRYIRPANPVDRATMAAIMMNSIQKGIIFR